jgi:formylglycine-generating enzyme required for sulfatase activity
VLPEAQLAAMLRPLLEKQATLQAEIAGHRGTRTVGCFRAGASPYLFEEISGNVWEWTRSIRSDYPYHTTAEVNDVGERAEDYYSRAVRGGSFEIGDGHVRCASRFSALPRGSGTLLGFRVVVSSYL